MVHGARCIDADLDGPEVVDVDELSSVPKPVASGRVLPKWAPAKSKGSSVPPSNLFQEFGYAEYTVPVGNRNVGLHICNLPG
jgi:bloom syndrome protein